MKKAIFITVRTGSSRLPQKALIKIAGITTIEHLIERVKHSKKKDGIVLCTTQEPADDVLVEIAANHGIESFRGSTEDKLERWNGAAKKFGVEFLVTADADNLFYEPELIDLAFDQYEINKPDFIAGDGRGIIVGSFTYGIKAAALERVCRIKDSTDTEMMWVYFLDTGLFKCEDLDLEKVPDVYKHPEFRITLDYPDDLRFFETIIHHFNQTRPNEYYNLRDVVAYLNENPDIIKINQYLMKQFRDNQKQKTSLKLKPNYRSL